MAMRGQTEEQILRALHQAEGGTRISDLCREHGISEATYYVWKKKYAALTLSELREKNSKLERLIADLSLDRHMLQEIVRKRF
jgi:putative transposase